MLHEPATPAGKDPAGPYKTRLGIRMFIFYSLFYAGFVAINLLSPLTMGAIVFAGLNLATVYGFALIIVALIEALIYDALCRRKEAEFARAEKQQDDKVNSTRERPRRMAIFVFFVFVVFVIGLSLYLGNRAKTSAGYYAAGGNIHWGVNGIAFAGDYLSAASFLGICGLIATAGYDGFLYSIGYLAGWIVALFVVAEPLKRLGKYTFTDAVDANYNSRGIKLAAAISTLVVSICYLIPQMVGAGVLVEPLLGIPHAWGVIMVGAIVITIVATAGMASTTYVQFLKGALLIIFSTVSGGCARHRAASPPSRIRAAPCRSTNTPTSPPTKAGDQIQVTEAGWDVLEQKSLKGGLVFVKLGRDGKETWW